MDVIVKLASIKNILESKGRVKEAASIGEAILKISGDIFLQQLEDLINRSGMLSEMYSKKKGRFGVDNSKKIKDLLLEVKETYCRL